VVLKIQASKSTLTFSRKGEKLKIISKRCRGEAEKAAAGFNKIFVTNPYMDGAHGNRLSPGLPSPGVELFSQKEVGLSPTFHVVLLKVQE